jgi:membrane associated rhomboid family serine protease
MLSDRSYMRDPQPGGRTSVVVWLVAAIAAGFILQNFVTKILGQGLLLEAVGGLSLGALRAGHFWTLLTYGFLHPQNDLLFLLQIIFIGLAVYFLGNELLPVLGPRRLLGLYAATLIAGGLAWVAANPHAAWPLLGASPAVAGLLIVFACFFPNREFTILVFFFLPVTVKPKYLALACLAIDLFGCAFYEALGRPSPLGLAHSAHLGGMAAGWLYYRFVHQAEWRRPGRTAAIELPRWMKRTPPGSLAAPAYQVNLGNREHLRAEVDRILDKINSQGFGALTSDEKRLLDEARDLLSRR